MARHDPDEAIRQIQNADKDVRRWKKLGRDDHWIEDRKLTKYYYLLEISFDSASKTFQTSE